LYCPFDRRAYEIGFTNTQYLGMKMHKSTAIVYHYYEKDSKYRDNLIYFLSVGIIDEHDYYIVIAGGCTIKLPLKENIFYIKTVNKNNDYGGYSEFIKTAAQKLQIYKFFIFINSSVRGPFLPNYSAPDWTVPFIKKLSNDTHLVGSSINALPINSEYSKILGEISSYHPPFTHVQTTSYALTSEALNHLISLGFFDIARLMSKEEVIAFYELRLSKEIIKNGWNFSSSAPLYDDKDYRNQHVLTENNSAVNGDVLFKKGFMGRTLNPYDLIFIKVNRDMLPIEELDSYTYTSLSRISSKDLSLESNELISKSRENIEKYIFSRKKFQRVFKFFGIRKLLSKLSRFT
jgi:hypothetical protein